MFLTNKRCFDNADLFKDDNWSSRPFIDSKYAAHYTGANDPDLGHVSVMLTRKTEEQEMEDSDGNLVLGVPYHEIKLSFFTDSGHRFSWVQEQLIAKYGDQLDMTSVRKVAALVENIRVSMVDQMRLLAEAYTVVYRFYDDLAGYTCISGSFTSNSRCITTSVTFSVNSIKG